MSDALLLTYAAIGQSYVNQRQQDIVDFAVKGKKGKGSFKECKQGFPCGYSCISRAKTCRSALPGQAKQHADWLKRQSQKALPAKTQAKDYAPLAQAGAQVLGSTLRKLDEAIAAGQPEVVKAQKAFDKVSDLDPVKAYQSPEWKALVKAESVPHPADVIMGEIREKLRKMPASTAEGLAKQTKIAKSASKVVDEQTIRANLAEFYAMTGGRGSDSLKTIKYVDSRAHADQDGVLNIGKQATPSEVKQVFFHEMGHHIEFEKSHIRVQLGDWIKARSNGAEPEPLSKLSSNKNYGPDEVARPDKFIDPYVGKVYPDGSTEALSMGIEKFTTRKSMLDFYKADKEHFLLIVGILND